MNSRNRFRAMIRLFCLVIVLVPISIAGQQPPNPEAETLFNSAIADYRLGKFDAALASLAKATALNKIDGRQERDRLL